MRFTRIIAAVLLVGLGIALLVGAYQAGLVVGAGSAGTAAATVPAHWYGPAWFVPWFGFGLFHLFGLILFVLLIVGLVRLVFWGGHDRRAWGHDAGPRGDWDRRMRDYHDSLHASAAGTPEASGSTPRTAPTSTTQADGDDRPTAS